MLNETVLCGDGKIRTERDLRTKSHRELYGDQYSHPLCGKRVQVRIKSHPNSVVPDGTIERVVSSRFGVVASAPEWGTTWYLVSDCQPI